MLPSLNRYEESLATHGTTGTTNFNPPELTNSVGSEWARIGFPNSWTHKNIRIPMIHYPPSLEVFFSKPGTNSPEFMLHGGRISTQAIWAPTWLWHFQPSKNDAWKLIFQPSPGGYFALRETNIFTPSKKIDAWWKNYILEMIPKKTGGIFVNKHLRGYKPSRIAVEVWTFDPTESGSQGSCWVEEKLKHLHSLKLTASSPLQIIGCFFYEFPELGRLFWGANFSGAKSGAI